MADPLLQSLQSFGKCTAVVEQEALDRLAPGPTQASRGNIDFALKVVNQSNRLFSQKTAEIRKLCETNDKSSKSIERLSKVVVAGFRLLYGAKETAGFGPLALEKTLSNFTALCANAHMGERAWDGLILLRQWLEDYAEEEEEKQARQMKGAQGRRNVGESLARNMRRLSVKAGDTSVIHFPIESCKESATFNNMVVTLLCNFLRILAQCPGSACALQVAEALTVRENSALEWCVEVLKREGASSGMEPFLNICFRSYLALGAVDDELALDIRLLGITAYSHLAKCDGRELLKYAMKSAMQYEADRLGQTERMVRIAGFYQRISDIAMRRLAAMSVTPEVVEFVQHWARTSLHTSGISKALQICQLVLHTSQGSDNAHARLVSGFLSFELLVKHSIQSRPAHQQLADVAAEVRQLAFEAIGPKARHTLAGWNSLAICADSMRRTAKSALAALRSSQSQLGQTRLASDMVHVLDVAGRTYNAYISRGAAEKAAAGGGATVSSFCDGNAEVYLVALQLATQFVDDDAVVGSVVQRHSDLLLLLCRKAQCNVGFLRSHSTVFFNKGASQYQLHAYTSAARLLEFAIQSMVLWIEMASDGRLGEDEEAEAVGQLWKRYEILAAAHQAAMAYEEAAMAFSRAIGWTVRRFADRLIATITQPGDSVVVPPSSSLTESSAAARVRQFIDRYVRMCAVRLARDSDEVRAQMSVLEYAGELPESRLLQAWMCEVEAYCWRPFSTQAGVGAVRAVLLERAMAMYEGASSVGYARCLVELAKEDRDGGRVEKCLDRLHAAQEIAKQQHGGSSSSNGYVVGVVGESYAWQAVVAIEQGAAESSSSTSSLGMCGRLWAALLKDIGHVDSGFLRDVADLMQYVLGLLLSRRLYAQYCTVQTVLLDLAMASERSDSTWAPTVMESLVGLATGCLLVGQHAHAAEHFRMAAFRYGSGVLPVHVDVAAKLAFAEFQIACGDVEGGAQTMQAASDVAYAGLDLGGHPAAGGKRQAKATPETLLVLARAASVYSQLSLKRGELANAVDFGVQGYRILTSVLQSLSLAKRRRCERAGQSIKEEEEEDPFNEPSKPRASGNASEATKTGEDVDGLEYGDSWALQHALIESIVHLVELYSVRGSVKECQYFLSKGLEVAERIRAPLQGEFLGVRKIDVLSRKHVWNECAEALQRVRQPVGAAVGRAEAVALLVVEGDAWRRCGEYQRAAQVYDQAAAVLDGKQDEPLSSLSLQGVAEVTPRIQRIIGQTTPYRQTVGCQTGKRVNGVDTLVVLREDLGVRQQILADMRGQAKDSPGDDVKRTVDQQPEHLVMRATLLFAGLQRMLARAGWAQVFESALLLPGLQPSTPQPEMAEVGSLLCELDELLVRAVSVSVTVGSAHCVHESSHLLALVRILAAAFGIGQPAETISASYEIARVIDGATNVTVVREAVDAMRRRNEPVPPQLVAWPTEILNSNNKSGNRHERSPPASPSVRSQEALVDLPKHKLPLVLGQDSDDDEKMDHDGWLEGVVDGARIAAAWSGESTNDITAEIPASWVVCGISIDRVRNLMFVTRYAATHSPVVLSLPMRAVVEPVGAESHIGGDSVFDSAFGQLTAIIAESDRSMKNAGSCTTDDEKHRWWQQRTDLDCRLGALLKSVEDEWLGGFRHVLQPTDMFAPQAGCDIDKVREKIHSCVVHSLPSGAAMVLDDAVCWYVLRAARALSRGDTDDDWLDVCAMLLDMYCYRVAATAVAEDVVSQFASDLKLALQEDSMVQEEPPWLHKPQRRHLVLVLDKHAQQIPWESLPCLRDYPVSRVPSLVFLRQQIARMRAKRSRHSPPSLFGSLLSDSRPAGVSVDGSSVYYVLNPEGDLHRTQHNFEAYLQAIPSWAGAIGRPVASHECAHGLTSSSIFLYFGHGGGERYMSRAQLRSLPRCAVALLVGCSSGQLKPAGEYDAMGTAMDYMIAGCPALLANLWDVGDKDIDRFTARVLGAWGIGDCSMIAVKSEGSSDVNGGMSLSEAVCEARKVCRMPFLTAAAPVVYGIPAFVD